MPDRTGCSLGCSCPHPWPHSASPIRSLAVSSVAACLMQPSRGRTRPRSMRQAPGTVALLLVTFSVLAGCSSQHPASQGRHRGYLRAAPAESHRSGVRGLRPGGHSADHGPAVGDGTVTGTLVLENSALPGTHVLPTGRVVAVSAGGSWYTVSVRGNGRYRLSLPPGTYQLAAYTPIVRVHGAEVPCEATQAVQVTAGATTSGIEVVCLIPEPL